MNMKNNEKPSFFRRSIAYLIDMILATLLATAISMVFIDNTNYNSKTEELMALTKSYTDGEITKEKYSEEFDNLNYYLTKESTDTTIVTVSVSLVYYVILCYFCHGITLGKYIMKLRIVSANDKELNIGNYLIRGLLINLILSSLLSLICIYTMNKDTFISVYPKLSNVITIFLLVCIMFTAYRNDGRGLHDLAANTKVISTKEVKVIEETKEEVVEAKVIEEKKTNNKKKEAKK